MGGRTVRVETVDALKYVAWKDGFFYYDNEPLENILNELGRWFDFTVFYQNPEVKSYRFKFWANRKDTPEEIMERLNETGKLHVRFNGEECRCLVVIENVKCFDIEKGVVSSYPFRVSIVHEYERIKSLITKL